MANQPRVDNPARAVRVEDWLWEAAGRAAYHEGTTRGEVMRHALVELLARNVTWRDRLPDLHRVAPARSDQTEVTGAD